MYKTEKHQLNNRGGGQVQKTIGVKKIESVKTDNTIGEFGFGGLV